MAMAQALSDLFAGRTQAEIAAHLSAAGFPIEQTKVSRWVRGATEPRLDEVAAVEQAMGRPRGWLLARAGYAELPGVEPVTPPAAAHAAVHADTDRRIAKLTAEVSQLRDWLVVVGERLGLVLTELDADEPTSPVATPAEQAEDRPAR